MKEMQARLEVLHLYICDKSLVMVIPILAQLSEAYSGPSPPQAKISNHEGHFAWHYDSRVA